MNIVIVRCSRAPWPALMLRRSVARLGPARPGSAPRIQGNGVIDVIDVFAVSGVRFGGAYRRLSTSGLVIDVDVIGPPRRRWASQKGSPLYCKYVDNVDNVDAWIGGRGRVSRGGVCGERRGGHRPRGNMTLSH